MTSPEQQPAGPQRRPPSAPLRARALASLRFSRGEAAALAILGLLVLAGATLAYSRTRPVALPPADLPASSSPASTPIMVHVVGAVRVPGVYELPEGARVIEAVRAAGGLTRAAVAEALNLARPVTDGEQVIVPRRGAAVAAGATAPGQSNAGARVNLNTAGVEQLDALPGIGPVLARRIIEYRERHGPFRRVQELLQVPGIGQRKFDSLKDLVTV